MNWPKVILAILTLVAELLQNEIAALEAQQGSSSPSSPASPTSSTANSVSNSTTNATVSSSNDTAWQNAYAQLQVTK